MENKKVDNVNNKKENITSKNKSKKNSKTQNSKLEIKDPKKFCVGMIILVIFVVIVVTGIKLISKVEVTSNTDIASLNANRYSKEILAEYEKDGIKDKFIEDYDLVQGAIGLYIMNNYTSDENSFKNIINELTTILKKDDWSKLDIEKPIFWNGNWTIDGEGYLTFTFKSKDIEPSWINSEDLTGKVILNK